MMHAARPLGALQMPLQVLGPLSVPCNGTNSQGQGWVTQTCRGQDLYGVGEAAAAAAKAQLGDAEFSR